MPYKSMAQARMMHAKHPRMAMEWDKETDFDELPERKAAKKKGRLAALKAMAKKGSCG